MKPTTLLARACIAVLFCASFGFDHNVDATTPAPPTDVPATLPPGVFDVCNEQTDLNDSAGNVSFSNRGGFYSECYNIACDKDVVIRFSANAESYLSTARLYTLTGTDFRVARSLFQGSSLEDVDIVLSGQVFVQFRGSHIRDDSVLDINYMCVDATSPAPPTDVPAVPDVPHSCNEVGHNAGQASFASNHTECWRIECENKNVISFAVMDLYDTASVALYSSLNGTDYRLTLKFTESRFRVDRATMRGTVFVQLESGSSGADSLEFSYECVDVDTTDAPSLATYIPAGGPDEENGAGSLNLPNYLAILFPCFLIALIMS